MNRVRVLLTMLLLVALPGVAEAKFHLFKRRHPQVSPGGHILGHHTAAHSASKHKAHTRTNDGH